MARQSQASTRKAHNIWIQPRDLEMLLSIGTTRMLTTQMLEWLHFASWRDRYKERIKEAEITSKTAAYRPARQVHERLAGMEHYGLIMRSTRTADRGMTHFQRLPDVFALTHAGADLLCARLGVELRELSITERRARAIQNLEHSIAIGQFYAALRAELEHRKLALLGWRGDNWLHMSYDQVYAVGQSGKTSIIPDATCVLGGQRLFIEIDRGTRPLKTWATKTYAYEAYRGSSQLRDRYDVGTFKVLIVAPTKTRMERIAAEIATVTRTVSSDYLFILESMVHPTTIRRNWNTIASTTLRKKQVVNKLIETSDIQLRRCDLWGHADES
jgi:hypothetical protein